MLIMEFYSHWQTEFINMNFETMCVSRLFVDISKINLNIEHAWSKIYNTRLILLVDCYKCSVPKVEKKCTGIPRLTRFSITRI